MLMNFRPAEPEVKVLQRAVCQRLSAVTTFAYALLEWREKSVGDVHRLVALCGGCRRVAEQCTQCCGRRGWLENRFVKESHSNQAGQIAAGGRFDITFDAGDLSGKEDVRLCP